MGVSVRAVLNTPVNGSRDR